MGGKMKKFFLLNVVIILSIRWAGTQHLPKMKLKDLNNRYSIEEIKKANEDRVFEFLFNNLLENNKYDPEQAEKFPSFYKFITGEWLEDLVLITLQKLQKEEKTMQYI